MTIRIKRPSALLVSRKDKKTNPNEICAMKASAMNRTKAPVLIKEKNASAFLPVSLNEST